MDHLQELAEEAILQIKKIPERRGQKEAGA